jgi:hypothetical protein
MAAHPYFGIGPGNFADLSGVSNNAHNNYLQIAAEMGIPAAVVFIYIAAFSVRTSWREARQSLPSWGLCLGLLAYLVTCLAGHPLLVGGAAYPFWMAMGIAAVSTSAPSQELSKPSATWMSLVAVLVVAATVPLRIAVATRDADVEHSSVGFSKWHQGADGSRYRWAGGRATFYVSPEARSIRIPLRTGPQAPATLDVRIYLDGIEANRVTLRSDEGEKVVRLNLFRRAKTRFARIDLESCLPGETRPLAIEATEAGGVLLVGRPVPES